MKFAFVTRKKFDDATKHIVIGTHTLNTLTWAKQLNFFISEMWKKLKYVIDLVQEDKNLGVDAEDTGSEFILLKDVHKQSFRLYRKNDEE